MNTAKSGKLLPVLVIGGAIITTIRIFKTGLLSNVTLPQWWISVISTEWERLPFVMTGLCGL